MSDQNIGPFFGVPLPAHLDFPGGIQKELPTAKELVSVVDGATPHYRSLTARTVASLEASLALVAAIDRGGYAVSPCLICQELVVGIPDGLPMCRHAQKRQGARVTNSAEYIAQHGHSDDYEPDPAVEPCGYPAGSLGKLEAMRLRAELGQDIWHPQDCQAMATPAESQAMSDHVIWYARETKYSNRRGS